MPDDPDKPEPDIFDDAREVVEDSQKLADDIEEMYERVRETASARDLYEKNPYAVLAGAFGAGYLLGGGLFTPFTRRMLKTGMKALVIPVAVSRLREIAQATGSPELEEHLEGDSTDA